MLYVMYIKGKTGKRDEPRREAARFFFLQRGKKSDPPFILRYCSKWAKYKGGGHSTIIFIEHSRRYVKAKTYGGESVVSVVTQMY